MTVEKALRDLRKGKFILIHDSEGRENEIDIVIAAEKITPQDVAVMRSHAGGLICAAVSKQTASKLNLPFIQEVYAKSKMEIFKALKADDIPYDEKSAFSLTVNHRRTFTGITDKDRALTIRGLAGKPSMDEFGRNFRTPGHVSLLISSGIENRKGHTELSTAMLEMASLTPVAAICEMLDSKTNKALSLAKAREYARKHKITLINTEDILKYWRNQK